MKNDINLTEFYNKNQEKYIYNDKRPINLTSSDAACRPRAPIHEYVSIIVITGNPESQGNEDVQKTR